MATYDILKDLNTHFKDNWSSTSIQFEGMNLSTKSLSKWISLTYNPVLNEQLGGNYPDGCRVKYNGIWKVFCYAKNPTKVYQLMGDVNTFLNGKQIGNVNVAIGQEGTATKLNNTWYEGLCTFQVDEI